jgi:hypothetical protein
VIPIYDLRTTQVAWFDGENIFDLGLRWIAFHSNGHFFSSSTLAWLGPFHDGSLLDRNGRPVAWLAGSNPSGTLKPLTPLKPLKPLTPLRPLQPLKPLNPLNPLTPLGGWSGVQWQQWLG